MLGLKPKAMDAKTGRTFGTGWLPPAYDPRDYTDRHDEIAPILKAMGNGRARATASLPSTVDLRSYCSPVEDQGQLGSCTANAAIGMVEYYERRARGNFVEGSRLFVYKTTRNLLGVTGDTGAWLRNTMGALALCGVAPERYWPYTDQAPEFDTEPTNFVYAIADNYEALKYFAHDPLNKPRPKAEVLESVKTYLVKGVPSVFGFFGFESTFSADDPAAFAVPTQAERDDHAIKWGHAILAIGYDDGKGVTNTVSNEKSKGAFLIRNSWGTGWGNQGYGWLPYDYVKYGIALDFWSLTSQRWVNPDKFDIGLDD